ncbi:MAG: MBL fold metallo-hydrolase [SAR324 cluster bacterium]|nr:MBL fold metallo-hydrolase [SAR324 cluster bacterium]
MKKSAKIHMSVAAVFTYQNSVFIIRRQPYLLAFPGYHSFPGGKVDKDDSGFSFHTQFLEKYDPTLMRALCREIKEEVHFDLEEAIQSNVVSDFSELGVAIGPPFLPHRFHTHFFRVQLKSRIDFTMDSSEAEWSGWQALRDCMEQYYQGEVLIALPTWNVIKALAEKPDVRKLGMLHVEYDPEAEVPCLEFVHKMFQIPVLSHTLPPAERTNAFIIGDPSDGSYLIDPSPSSEKELKRLLQTLAAFEITGIFLTHHHPDHHEFSNQLAELLKVPVQMSNDTYHRIVSKHGAVYFKDLEVQIAHEGDILTRWLGKDIRVYEIPGHDEGQLGLAPVSMEWFLVGDLIQGIGTVVIGQPEGNMAKYFVTLERIIRLDPKVIIPSHGIPMRTTTRLKAALKHRKMRENQVLQCYQDGKTKDQTLAEIYHDIDPRLLPAAMKNIESHLIKLKEEQRL